MHLPARVISSLSIVALLLSFQMVPGQAFAQATPIADACQATPTATVDTVFPLVVIDDAGREVTIEREPERIISIAPSNTEILFALGLGERIVGVDSYSNYPPEAVDKPQVGEYIAPSLETIALAEPDLVLASEVHRETVVPALENLQVPTVIVEPVDLDEVFASIDLIGQMTGVPAAADALVCSLEARAAAVSAAIEGAPPTSVFFELGPELYSAGPGSFVDDILTRAGGENIAADAGQMWPQLSAEAVIAADPRVILLADHEAGVTPELVAERSGWQGVSAVVDGRVVDLDADLMARPGPRLIDGLEAAAAALHPDRFPEATP